MTVAGTWSNAKRQNKGAATSSAAGGGIAAQPEGQTGVAHNHG